MNKLENVPLLYDLKLIIIDYMGENKYQLNYKKCIKEYSILYTYYNQYNNLDGPCTIYNYIRE